MSSYIYKISFPNGKCYIGQTKQTFNDRMSRHKSDAITKMRQDGCRALNAAIRKYGWDNCTREILEECKDEELNDKERYYVAKFNTLSPSGYNLTTGGDGGQQFSAETKKLMSDKAKVRGVKRHQEYLTQDEKNFEY